MTTVLLVLAGVFGAVVFLMAGLRDLAQASARRRQLAEAVSTADGGRITASFVSRLDRALRTTRPGRWLEHQLILAGMADRPVVVVVTVALLLGVAVGWVLGAGLAPVFGLGGVAAFVIGIRAYLARARERRREQFIAQMPELARVLSNATGAGLSIASALQKASQELAEPAGSELARVASRMRFGESLQVSVSELEERLPSREVSVLVSTLVVSARSGGSLVTSLRDIADTLDARKEVRREVRTTLAQSTSTGYLVIAVGIGILFLLNTLQPGTVQAMTESLVGQVALLIGGGLFAIGFLVIRRMTRFDG